MVSHYSFLSLHYYSGIIDKNPQPYMCPVITFKPQGQPEAESCDKPKEATQGNTQNDEDQGF